MIEIPLLDYVDTNDEKVMVYIHTKDKRTVAVHDVRSNLIIDKQVVYIDYMHWGRILTCAIPREDFSHIEYYYEDRQRITKKDFDELHSFIEEQIYPPDLLTEPDEGLFEDLI